MTAWLLKVDGWMPALELAAALEGGTAGVGEVGGGVISVTLLMSAVAFPPGLFACAISCAALWTALLAIVSVVSSWI